jgi:hypothetical protein
MKTLSKDSFSNYYGGNAERLQITDYGLICHLSSVIRNP